MPNVFALTEVGQWDPLYCATNQATVIFQHCLLGNLERQMKQKAKPIEEESPAKRTRPDRVKTTANEAEKKPRLNSLQAEYGKSVFNCSRPTDLVISALPRLSFTLSNPKAKGKTEPTACLPFLFGRECKADCKEFHLQVSKIPRSLT